jgi:hypothetical protein
MCFWPRARRRPFKPPRQEQPYIRLQSLQHERPDISTQLLRPETPVIRSQLSQHEQADSLPDLFQHEPLDLKTPSIRLIQIHPAHHSEDRMRCTLRLASIDTKYTCLSYVWGDEHTGDWIHLNNMRFFVRQNLLDFLRSARRISDLTSQWLWIDALCIDQTNTPERQHQVQQMGRIYAGAKEVVSWLGIQKDIITLFRDRPENGRRKVDGVVALSLSRYWWRAWIIQEIILGPHVRLMAGAYILPLDELPPYHTAMSRKFNHYGAIQTRVLHMRKLLQAREQPEVTLICLLHHFQYQQCHVTRDRIFSLLGLCKNGVGFKVDYSIPDYKLALRVLAYCSDSFCLCSVHTVARALELPLSTDLGDYGWGAQSAEYTYSYTSLTLLTLRGKREDLQTPGDRDRQQNSDYTVHHSRDGSENKMHRMEFSKVYSERVPREPKVERKVEPKTEYETENQTEYKTRIMDHGRPKIGGYSGLHWRDGLEKDTHIVENQRSHSEHTPSEHEIDYKIENKVRIVINLHHLCSAYRDELEIELCSKRIMVIYRQSGDTFDLVRKWDLKGGIALELLDNGLACRVLLPLDFWFWVAKMSGAFAFQSTFDMLQDTCCPRITRPENQQFENSREPGLQLLTDIQPDSTYFTVPRNIDQFVDFCERRKFEW